MYPKRIIELNSDPLCIINVVSGQHSYSIQPFFLVFLAVGPIGMPAALLQFMKTKRDQMKIKIKNFLAEEKAATSVEYAIMLTLIIGVCIVGIQVLGIETNDTMTSNSEQITNAIQR